MILKPRCIEYRLIFWLKKLHVWLVEGKSPFLGVMLSPMLTHAISYLGDGLIWWTFMEALPWDSLGWWRSWIVEFRAVNCGRLGNRTTGSCVVKPIIYLQLFMVYTSCFWWIWGLFFFSVYYLTWNDSSRIAARFLSPSLVKNKRRCRISNPRMQSCIDV